MLAKRMSALNFESPVANVQLRPTGILRIQDGSQQRYYLEELPQELFVHVISMLPLSDVGTLSLTGSSRIQAKIIDWITSRSFLKKISSLLAMPVPSLVTEDGLESWKQVTSEFGLLVKKLSMIYGTSHRLRLLSAWYSRLYAMASPGSGNTTWGRFLGSVGLASALDSFTLGWDVVEDNRVLGWLREIVAEDLVGDRLRLLRLYFWQYSSSDQCRGTWTAWMLSTFTKPGQSCQAARLLMCLFGPADLQLSVQDNFQLSYFQQKVLTKALGKPDYDGLQGFQFLSYDYAKFRFVDLGKSLTCLLQSPLVTQSYLLNLLIGLFKHSVLEPDSQGKFLDLCQRFVSSQSLFSAACLLFSCERLVKIYLNHLTVQESQTGDYRHLAKVLVSLTVTADRLENTLDQGMERILRFAFNVPGEGNRTKLFMAFIKELRRRMELEEVSVETICQLGVFVTFEVIEKEFFDD